jgi:hypothetical protein
MQVQSLSPTSRFDFGVLLPVSITGDSALNASERRRLKCTITDAATDATHRCHPRGKMVNEQGQPTRLALSAHTWGEPVHKTVAAAAKLAAKATKLLKQYRATKISTSE